jgi:hypothetical protein
VEGKLERVVRSGREERRREEKKEGSDVIGPN